MSKFILSTVSEYFRNKKKQQKSEISSPFLASFQQHDVPQEWKQIHLCTSGSQTFVLHCHWTHNSLVSLASVITPHFLCANICVTLRLIGANYPWSWLVKMGPLILIGWYKTSFSLAQNYCHCTFNSCKLILESMCYNKCIPLAFGWLVYIFWLDNVELFSFDWQQM